MSQQNKTELKKDSVNSNDKNKEMNWREKIAHSIAGDNEMMNNAIKFITHPIVMFGGMLAFFYWLFKDKGQKEEIEKLQKENETVKKAFEGLEKQLGKLKTSQTKLEEEFSKVKKETTSGFGMLPNKNHETKRFHTAYLD